MTDYYALWVCKACGGHDRLPFGSVYHAPRTCPGCGGESRWVWQQYERVIARRAWRPRGLRLLRFPWVDRDGREVGLAALEAEAGQ